MPCRLAAEGAKADIVKPMHGLGSGVFEIALPYRGNAFRVIYGVQFGDEIWAVHAFQRKSAEGLGRPDARSRSSKTGSKCWGGVVMKRDKLDVVRGSGNAFSDLGIKNPAALQLKAMLAAEIIKVLDHEGMTVRAAQQRTGIAAADFSRIRNADLGRFTVDRLISIIGRLGSRVEVRVKVRPGKTAA
jgi:predicted XRE-type DNA-binding protein